VAPWTCGRPRLIAGKSTQPIEVRMASWSPRGKLDWWVKDRQEWWGCVRGADGGGSVPLISVPRATHSQITLDDLGNDDIHE
jgi:hypothetical protein